MTTDIDICNLALSKLDVYPITSFVQGTKESRSCSAQYLNSLKSVLEDHPWSFAYKALALTLATPVVDYLQWEYAYNYPTDCIAIRRINNGQSSSIYYDEEDEDKIPEIEYDIMAKADLASKVIVTNKEDAILEYTAYVIAPEMFTSLFIEALAYKLAGDLAITIRGDSKLQSNMYGLYQQSINKAKLSDSKQFYKKRENDSDFIEVRR